jgi:hypothetical protein
VGDLELHENQLDVDKEETVDQVRAAGQVLRVAPPAAAQAVGAADEALLFNDVERGHHLRLVQTASSRDFDVRDVGRVPATLSARGTARGSSTARRGHLHPKTAKKVPVPINTKRTMDAISGQ